MPDILYVVENVTIVSSAIVVGGLFGTAAHFTLNRIAKFVEDRVDREFERKKTNANLMKTNRTRLGFDPR